MYKLQPPKFKVHNLLSDNGNMSSNRQITWKPVTNAAKYNIYRSYVPYSLSPTDLTLLGTVDSPATEYVDTTTSILSNNDFKDLAPLTINTWGGWYYRMTSVRANGEEGIMSDPMSENDVSNLSNPPYGEYQVGDDKTYGYCGTSTLPTGDDTDLFLEIRARNLNTLQRDGQWVWYFKQRGDGKRCPNWQDDIQQCRKTCPLCHGTGLATTEGYYSPVKILARLVGAGRQLMSERQGLRIYYEASNWTIWTPILSSRDLIVTNDGRRYEITSVTPSIARGNVWLHQSFQTRELPRTDPLMKLPVPGPLY